MKTSHVKPGSYSASRSQRGFVLVYVAAIVVFLTGLLTYGVGEQRAQLRIVAALSEHESTKLRLDAGTTWLAAHLAVVWSTPPANTQANLPWLAAVQPAQVVIDGQPLIVSSEDADLRPDINALSEAEWQRLLQEYGIAAEPAGVYAKMIYASRQAAGEEGFSRVDQVMHDPRLPQTLATGYADNPLGPVPPLEQLLSVGSKRKRLHVQYSHLALFAMMQGSPSQLKALQAARKSRQLSVADAELIFGSPARRIVYADAPGMLRFRLLVSGVPLEQAVLAWVEKGQLKTRTLPPTPAV